MPLGPRVDTINNAQDEVAHCNRNLKLINREVETMETLEGEVQAAVVTLETVRVATAFKKLPFQVGCHISLPPLTFVYTHMFYFSSCTCVLSLGPPSFIHNSYIFSHLQLQEDIRFFSVEEAPAPKHVLWRNLTSPCWVRRVRTGLVWTAVFTLIVGYTIPVGFASSLANLQGLVRTSKFSWLKPILDISPALTGFIQGFLPPLVVVIFLAFLPAFLKYLSRKQGFLSQVGGDG